MDGYALGHMVASAKIGEPFLPEMLLYFEMARC
jgi:hypothetical protein